MRREKNVKKFAEKTSKNKKYAGRWFPEKQIVRTTRHTTKYLEEQGRGDRLYKILYSLNTRLRNKLNGTNYDRQINTKSS